MTKKLVVCCDGTWNIPDQKDGPKPCPSNVAKMGLAIAPCDQRGQEQRVFYLKGLGTGRFDHFRGGVFGWGLSKNVQDAYRFLIKEYEPDDEIFLFGFSRGAYTARSTAGLIRNCGLLRLNHLDQIGAAYDLYRRSDEPSLPTGIEAQLFRKSFAYEVRIKFIGVWDTVGSLGIPALPWFPAQWLRILNKQWAFHDVKLSSYVDYAYQALAIDEQRKQFVPTLWQQQAHSINQTMEQAWFAGVHTNVGGGYQDSGLSDITFLWIKDRAEECGLCFDQAYIDANFTPNALGVLRDSRTGFFRLTGTTIRQIGKGASSNEAVYSTAVERTKAPLSPPYRPQNLMSYLEANGKVTPADSPLE